MDYEKRFLMPTTLGPQYTTEWRGNPPHMLEPDIPVWYRFLDQFSDRFLTLYYDSLLGGPTLTPDEALDRMTNMWRSLTSKRSDAIAELSNEIWIIEVAAHPQMRAIGQLITYEALWLEDPKINKPLKKILIAETIDADIATALQAVKITLHIV